MSIGKLISCSRMYLISVQVNPGLTSCEYLTMTLQLPNVAQSTQCYTIDRKKANKIKVTFEQYHIHIQSHAYYIAYTIDKR